MYYFEMDFINCDITLAASKTVIQDCMIALCKSLALNRESDCTFELLAHINFMLALQVTHCGFVVFYIDISSGSVKVNITSTMIADAESMYSVMKCYLNCE